jgi:hypothetical protein
MKNQCLSSINNENESKSNEMEMEMRIENNERK